MKEIQLYGCGSGVSAAVDLVDGDSVWVLISGFWNWSGAGAGSRAGRN